MSKRYKVFAVVILFSFCLKAHAEDLSKISYQAPENLIAIYFDNTILLTQAGNDKAAK